MASFFFGKWAANLGPMSAGHGQFLTRLLPRSRGGEEFIEAQTPLQMAQITCRSVRNKRCSWWVPQ